LHAACNFALCLFLAAPVLKILQEYQEKITYQVLSPDDKKDTDRGG
jgi:hypothetical protein